MPIIDSGGDPMIIPRPAGCPSLPTSWSGAVYSLQVVCHTCKLISVRTFGSESVGKCVAPIHAFSVPNACSTVCPSHSRTLDAVLAGIERSYGSPQVARDVAARALFGMMEAVSQRAAVRDPANLEPLASDLCRLFLGGFVGAPTGAQALPA